MSFIVEYNITKFNINQDSVEVFRSYWTDILYSGMDFIVVQYLCLYLYLYVVKSLLGYEPVLHRPV